jgi:rod shape-determining protein MreB
VLRCLGQAPPELAQDLILQGIHLVGGGGLLQGMARRLSDETALPVHLVDTPLETVVVGAGRCLDSFDSLKSMFISSDR